MRIVDKQPCLFYYSMEKQHEYDSNDELWTLVGIVYVNPLWEV
jgi:hypothetical protein